jgi:diamine N-acetyltransferase
MTHPTPHVSLREITETNRAAVEALAVSAEQDDYVAGVAESLVEAAGTPDAAPWFRAIYADDDPVGFVMLSDGITVENPDYLGPYFLWRLLVDQHQQGRGYGAAGLALAVEQVRSHPDARVLITSAVPGPHSPLGFYLRHGFRETGQVHAGEIVLELELEPADDRAR